MHRYVPMTVLFCYLCQFVQSRTSSAVVVPATQVTDENNADVIADISDDVPTHATDNIEVSDAADCSNSTMFEVCIFIYSNYIFVVHHVAAAFNFCCRVKMCYCFQDFCSFVFPLCKCFVSILCEQVESSGRIQLC